MIKQKQHNTTRSTAARWLGVFMTLWGAVALPAVAQVRTTFSNDIALSDRSPIEVVLYLISWFLGILAIIAVVLVLYGGWVWMTSQGNEEKIDKAKQILKNAAIGLLIILAAWGIVLYLLNVFSDATGTELGGGPGSNCTNCSFGNPSSSSDFYVLSTVPDAGEIDATLCAMQVRMSMDVDPPSVTTDTVTLRVAAGAQNNASCSENAGCASGLCTDGLCVGDTVAGEVALGPGDTTPNFVFLPAVDLETSTTYEATVEGGPEGVRSVDANPNDSIDNRLAMTNDYTWTFTTGTERDSTPPTVQINPSSPFPADGETNVCTNTVVNFDFSEAMLITSFNDTQSFVLDAAGTTTTPAAPDWANTVQLRNWNFGGNFDFAQARPRTALNSFSLYSSRLYAGDPSNDFAGAVTDLCSNPLDGEIVTPALSTAETETTGDGIAEGDPIDNFYGHDAASPEDPITWETGDNAECTPVITGITQTPPNYYGEYAGLRDGEACTSNTECASTVCTAGQCVGYGSTNVTINGLYLIPHPEVQFEGSVLWAGDGFNTCFDELFLGNVTTNAGVGDSCIDDAIQESSELQLRLTVGTETSTPVRVRVAGETSEPSTDNVSVESPHIDFIDPSNGAVGQYITISGGSFGEDNGTVVMRSADGVRESTLTLPEACGDVWADAEIVAIAPSTYINTATGDTGNWEEEDIGYIQVITAATGKRSNLVPFTFSNVVRPNLCAVEPQCQNAVGVPFTATGENFGDTQGGSDIFFASAPETGFAGNVSAWDDTVINGTTDTDMSIDEEYWVTVFDAETELSSNGRSYDIVCEDAPQVVNITTCDPPNGVYASPSPQPDVENACINGMVGILFDQRMNTSTFNSSTVYLKQYNTGGTFNANYTPLSVTGHFATTNWNVVIGSNSYYGFQYDIDQTFSDPDQNSQPNDPSPYLQSNTWYQLTITTGVQSTAGIPMTEPYTMTFKTNNSLEPCSIDSVDLSPYTIIKNTFPDQQNYTASAYDAACNLLDPNSYTWSWGSSNTNVGSFGTGPGSTYTQMVYVAGNDLINQGTSVISASAESEQDTANFIVDFGYCTSNADCASCAGSTCNLTTSHCTPIINDISTPQPTNGDNGTWVTINGCMFGPEKGNVYWTNPSYSEETDWPDDALCGDTWTINQIIAEVPQTREDGSPLDNGAYTIEVESTYGDVDSGANPFTINDTVRPGLCRVQPNSAQEGGSVVATGQNLGTTTGFASYLSSLDIAALPSNALDRISATTVTGWTANTITSEVPTGAIGTAYLASNPSTSTYSNISEGFRGILAGGDEQCVNGDFCTNSLNFNVSCQNDYGCSTGCCGDAGYCLPAEVCNTCVTNADCVASGQCTGSTCNNGQCTPVINSLYYNSGPLTAPVTVSGCYFGTYRSNDSQVTFEGVNANLLCGNSWSNNQIIVEVPNNATALPVGSAADVVVTNNVSSSNSQTYTVAAACYGGGPVPTGGHPLLCDLDPSTGTAATTASSGDTINFVGDNFTSTQTDVFNVNKVGNNFNFSSEQSTFAQVPQGAVTGPAYSNVSSCFSNGLGFGVACESNADCPNNYLCVGGICVDATCGFCSTTNPEAVCGEGNGCYYNSSTSNNCCATRPQLTETIPDNFTTELCPNALFDFFTSEPVTGQDNTIIEVIDVGTTLPSPLNSYVPSASENIVATIETSIDTNNLLQTNGTYLTHLDPKEDFPGSATGNQEDYLYRVVIPSNTDGDSTNVRSSNTGLHLQNGTEQRYFTVKANDCLPDALRVINDENQSDSFIFTEQNQTTSFTVTMYADDGTPLAPTDTTGWTYSWDPYENNSCNQVAWVEIPDSAATPVGGGPTPSSPTEETQQVTSGNVNAALESITVTAVPTVGWTGSLTDFATVRTFFCEPSNVWRYRDSDQKIDLVYCASEDVPLMPTTPAINSNPTATGADWFRQYLFTNPDNEEQAFGIRVYENTAHLTPSEWYDAYVPNPGNPQVTTVDGYEAVRDGNSYYISASNITNSGSLYNNIYLFTFNDNEVTNNIKDQILDFIHFNYNTSVRGCEGSAKAKLIRDTKRVNDLWRITRLADQYESVNGSYPLPESDEFGSFITTVTTSVWPSWQGALGNVLGETLPTDPYNFFNAQQQDTPWNVPDAPWDYTGTNAVLEGRDCGYNPEQNIYYDESGTCWDPVNNEFQCPANSEVYLWEIEGGVAKLYTNLEYVNTPTQDYKDTATINEYYAVTGDPCSNISNASCACVNYELTSEFGWDQRP